MPREFFIAPLVCGPGTIPGTQRCAPKVNPRQVNYVAACQPHTAPDPQCLVLAAGDVTGAEADTSLVTIISENFDTPIASLGAATRNRIQNGLTNKGIPLTLTDYTLVRDFLQALGLWFDPNFNLNLFWVSS